MGVRRKKKKVAPITTLEMEIAIDNYFGHRQNIIVPNISWGIGIHECDMFIVRKTGYCIEVEIKTSKSDLLADFNKPHKHKDRKNRIKEFYYAIPEKLIETCAPLIPEDIGIIVCYQNESRYNSVYARIYRPTKINNKAIPLTTEERLKVAHLGTMRIWSLKNKVLDLKTRLKS